MKYIGLNFNTTLKFRLPETFSRYQPEAEDAIGTAKTFPVSEISK